MQPFELPDFYVPYPARLNPNLEAARVHSKAWAYEMGILSLKESSAIWDERTFDAHDYALFCAYVHPDAPEAELNLLTDWYLWLFFFDDYFLEKFKRSHDMAGAKEYIASLPAFMPIHPTETFPVPTNPVERGLANLWPLTAFTKSVEWRIRFAESTKNQFESSLWELANINQNRIPNPIEFIEMRRVVGGALWSADLTEHAVFVEIPMELAATRPMRVLKDSFADAVHFRNDLFSYQREVEDEGENSNCVLVFETFFNTDTQTAADLTNDLLTSRLQQFEHTAVTELPLLFEEQAIDPEMRMNVLLYIKGLQDWQSGAHEWHQHSSRYMHKEENTSSTPSLLPTGLGTSAACIKSIYDTLGFRLKNYSHLSYHPVGAITLPTFYMPFSNKTNPHLASARQCSKQWARKIGMLDSGSSFSGAFIWDERKFDVANIAFACALIYPTVSASKLDLIACWIVWGFYADDAFPILYGNSRNMAAAKLAVARLSAFMPIDLSSSMPMTTNPMEKGLADLWQQTVEALPIDAKCFLRHSIEILAQSWLWELSNHIQNRIPDPVDYVEMRRKTIGASLVMVFPRLTQGEGIPLEIYRSRTMSELINTAIDCTWMANDIFSYQKEIEFEGELNNGVLVVQNFLGCDVAQAVDIVNALATDRIKQFEQIVATELPILFEHFNLDRHIREKILDYIESIQFMMYGNLQWHLSVDRYKEFELQHERLRFRSPIGIPTGLGTSAAQIATLLKAGKTKTATQTIQPKFAGLSPTGLGTSAARIVELLKAKGN